MARAARLFRGAHQGPQLVRSQDPELQPTRGALVACGDGTCVPLAP